jgi:hypothetical protein
MTHDEIEDQLKTRKCKELTDFKNFNEFNLRVKKAKHIKNALSNKSAENYILMKDYVESMLKTKEETSMKSKRQKEMKEFLDQQVRDKYDNIDKQRFLTDKEFLINKQILQKMSLGKHVDGHAQESLI